MLSYLGNDYAINTTHYIILNTILAVCSIILEVAVKEDAVVLTNDRYRDLRSDGPGFDRVISHRYTRRFVMLTSV